MNSVGRTLKEAKAINPDINLQSFVKTKEPVIKKMIGRRVPDIESKFRGKRFTIDVKMLGLENELMRPLLLNNSNAASGSKASLRHGTSFDLNYGKKHQKHKLVEPNFLSNLDFVINCLKINECPKCNEKSVEARIKDSGVGSPCELFCNVQGCEWKLSSGPDNIRGDGSNKAGLEFSKDELAFVYEHMRMGSQFEGYLSGANSLHLNSFSDHTYAKIRTEIQGYNNEMWDDNISIGHNLVKAFYRKYFPERVSPCKKYVWPIVSVDGSFDKRGYWSRHGISMVFEIYTGICLDANNLEKCFEASCDEKINIKYKGKKSNPKKRDCLDIKREAGFIPCPKNLFHGVSAEMEGENAAIMFRRAEDYGFQYRTYVSDGDAKVWPRLKDIYAPMTEIHYDMYGNCTERVIVDEQGEPLCLVKVECNNHLAKQLYKKIYNKISMWTPPKVTPTTTLPDTTTNPDTNTTPTPPDTKTTPTTPDTKTTPTTPDTKTTTTPDTKTTTTHTKTTPTTPNTTSNIDITEPIPAATLTPNTPTIHIPTTPIITANLTTPTTSTTPSITAIPKPASKCAFEELMRKKMSLRQ